MQLNPYVLVPDSRLYSTAIFAGQIFLACVSRKWLFVYTTVPFVHDGHEVMMFATVATHGLRGNGHN